MKRGWKTCELGEVLERTETVDPTRNPDKDFYYIDVSSVNNKTLGIEAVSKLMGSEAPSRARKLVRANDVLFATVRPTLKRIALVPEQYDEQVCSTGYFVLRGKEYVENQFLFYFLQTDGVFSAVKKLQKGASYPAITDSDVKGLTFSYPESTDEQRQIVAILDEAFACIDKAIANTEKNIQNARELFDSYLNNIFSNPGPDWEEKTLGDIATFRNGINFTKSSRGETMRIVGVRDFQQSFWAPMDSLETITADGVVPASDLLKENDILFVRSNGNKELIGRSLLVGPVSGKVTHSGFTIRARINDSSVLPHYICRYLKSNLVRQKMIEGGTGTNIKSLNQTMLSDIAIPLPSISEQQNIVALLNDLDEFGKSLKSVCRFKIVELDDVKKSILQKAFSGELTKPKSNVIEFPQKFAGITTTDLHAGIVSVAYKMHETKGKLMHFHHVKAEKIAHMAEAFLGIDLERNPTKMAAGPNDFPRMYKVEHRAKMANYFSVDKQNDVYTYRPGNKIDSIISRTENALGYRFIELKSLIDKMIPMDTKQAEILATTFAAWNNLLIDDKEPTDDEIVFEARENWHPDKLKIERDRFFKVIQWMRNENILPQGLGRKVEVREENESL